MPNFYWYENAPKKFEPGHGLGFRKFEGNVPFPRLASRSPKFGLISSNFVVNKRLDLRYDYIPKYDQGVEGACVGFAWSWAMSFLNNRFYDARKLYIEAQYIDPWSDTPPEEGTSVIAGAQVLQQQGHWRFARGITFPLAAFEGIAQFYYANTVDEIRYAIFNNIPVVLGVDWHVNFDSPEWKDYGVGGKRWWIGKDTNNLGPVRGGHAICCFGARDDIEAFVLVNSWGTNYPVVNIPYRTIEHLLQRGAEAIIPIDKEEIRDE